MTMMLAQHCQYEVRWICGFVDDGDVVISRSSPRFVPRTNRGQQPCQQPQRSAPLKFPEKPAAVYFERLSLNFCAPRQGRDFFCESEPIPFPYSAADKSLFVNI